jgi:hypothetical protein
MKFPSDKRIGHRLSGAPSGWQMLDEKLQDFESCCYAAVFFLCFCIAQ